MNYGFYKSAFGGQEIPPEKFNRYLSGAKAYLTLYSGGREIPSEYSDKVSFALCEIAELLFRLSSQRGVKSENTDGYSATYDADSLKLEISEILSLYLGETDILFKGEI
ncbi:MAG: hypothetical protein IJE44_03770 [Clostridia bacterium]|nr:hypothetical protein [Clostridia bacterium]